jgi:hypothetical protein
LANAEVYIGGVSVRANGDTATGAQTVTFTLHDRAGVSTLEAHALYSDENHSVATMEATITVDQVTMTGTFTTPADDSLGQAFVMQSIVNRGLASEATFQFGVFVFAANGVRIVSVLQTTEGNAAFGWIADINNALRSALPGGVALAGHAPVKAATTTDITLSGTQVVDGVSLGVGDRALVKNQAAGADNGIRIVAIGPWPRAADANTPTLVTGVVSVQLGTQRGTWALTTTGAIVLDTTPLVFAKLDGQVILTLFGAVGDNSTDCTAAVAAADAAAAATKYPLFVPPGTYLHTGYAPSAAGIQIQGAGRLVSVLKLSASATSAVSVTHDDVTFDDIAIDGGGHATGSVVSTNGKRTTFERAKLITAPVLLDVAAGGGFRIDDLQMESATTAAIRVTDYADQSWMKGGFNTSSCAAPLIKFVSPSTTSHDFVTVDESKWTVSSGDAAALTARQPVRIATTTFNAYISIDNTGTERAIAYECSFTQAGALANGPFYDAGGSPGTLTYSGATETDNYKAA